MKELGVPMATSSVIPDPYRDLLTKPIVASLGTVLPNGQPQVTPVWFDYDGTYIRVNTAAGRLKHKAMLTNPRVTVMTVDPQNPYRYLEVRGTVTRITEEGGADHIDQLAKRYLGVDTYPHHTPTETRVICYIEPQKTSALG